jgi:catechol 2,3-dioxygenase-like lactoylglutathione lyase family enzyme
MTFDHINLVVRDMEAACAFYGGVLGLHQTFERILEGEWISTVAGVPNAVARCIFLEDERGCVRLELLQYLQPRAEFAEETRPHAPGFRHIAFTVDDIEAWCARLQQAGAEFVSAPVKVPFDVGGRTKRLCYFRDPEGNLLELAEYR